MFRLLSALLMGLVVWSAVATAQQAKPRTDVAAWIKILETGDPLTQEEALENLAKSGPAGRAALPALKKIAADDKSPLRKKAVTTIFRIDPNADVSPAILLDGLKDAAAQEKQQSITLLVRAAANSPTLTKKILEALPELDAPTQTLLLGRVVHLSPTVYPVLEEAFRHKQPQVRAAALALANKLPTEAGKALAAIRELLKDGHLAVRFEAARLVWTIDAKKDDKPLLAVFKEAAQDADMRARVFAFLPTARPPVREPGLFELALRHGSAEVRLQAIEALAGLGKPPKELLTPLLDMVRTDVSQRVKALKLMRQVCPGEAKTVVRELIELSQSRQEDAVQNELYFLFILAGADAVKPLMELVTKDTSGDTYRMYRHLNALSRIGAPAVEPVSKLLDSEVKGHHRVGLRILSGMGPIAKPAVSRVVRLLDDPLLGDQAANCLGSMGAGARGATTELTRRALAPQKSPSRGREVEILLQIFPAPNELLPVLRKIVADDSADNINNRLKAVEALWLWEGDGKKFVPILKAILEKRQRSVPYDLWQLLSRLGADIEPCLPELFAQLKKDGYTNSTVLSLLAEIAPQVKYRPTADEVAALRAMVQESPVRDPRSSYSPRLQAALALLGFDRETEKALAVLKEELGQAKEAPLGPNLDRLVALGGKIKGVAPELLALAPRVTYRHDTFYRLLANLDPMSIKAKQAEFETRLLARVGGHTYAALLLQHIDANHPGAWKIYEQALLHPDNAHLGTTMLSLQTLGPKAKRLIPAVEKLLAHPNNGVRGGAAVCLWHLTGDGTKTVPVLVADLKERYRWSVADELRRMGRAAKAAVPDLMSQAEMEAGVSARILREAAFHIDHAAAFAWWTQRDAR